MVDDKKQFEKMRIGVLGKILECKDVYDSPGVNRTIVKAYRYTIVGRASTSLRDLSRSIGSCLSRLVGAGIEHIRITYYLARMNMRM